MRTNQILADIETGEIIPVEEVSKTWYRKPANYVLGQFDKDLENKREVSMTIPDESYTIREVLEKFTRGLPIDGVNEGNYENPEDFEAESFENAIDITDVEEQLTEVNKRIAEKKSKQASDITEAKKGAGDATTKEEASKATDKS